MVDARSFPEDNPHPVLRVTADGELVYANPASAPILAALGAQVGDRLPANLLEPLIAGASETPRRPMRLVSDHRTFSLIAVPVPELGAYNLYGTDITAATVIEKFPDLNPNPVMRIAADDTLLYANAASRPFVRTMGIAPGDALPGELRERISAWVSGERDAPIEVSGEGGLTIRLTPVPLPEFGFTNLYGTDVTALHAMNKFPDENPNPVLRVSRSGSLVYANPASEPVRRAMGVEVGEQLPEATFEHMVAICDGEAPNPLEVMHAGRIFELRVISVFEFDSINLYGTDVTAARQIEAERQKSDNLLLSILPPSVAERLKAGELVIADRFDELAILFADVVDFTPLAARLSPQEALTVLSQIFSVCDELVEEYGLEKIKTIGDAYMVIGGLKADPAQVERVADMGLDLLGRMADYRTPDGTPMEIRIGMHVGPAIGGVIGVKKFIYDVWGDTVNTASRMESHGVPGRIQVTEATYRRLRDRYAFERRGNIIVKGKGAMPVFLLLGRTEVSELARHAGC